MSQKKRIRSLPAVISLNSLDNLPPIAAAGSSQAGPAPSVRAAEKGGTALKTALASILQGYLNSTPKGGQIESPEKISLYAPDGDRKNGSMSFVIRRGDNLYGGRAPFEECSEILNKNLDRFVSEGIEINLPQGTETLAQCRIVGIGQGMLRLAPVPVDSTGN